MAQSLLRSLYWTIRTTHKLVSFWTPKPVPTFCALPLDVQLLILVELDIEDILHMRLVCQNLVDVTKERTVWLHMLRNMQGHRPIHLEKPLSLYSTADLEYLVVRAHVATKKWHSPSSAPRTTELWHAPDGDKTSHRPLLLSFLPGGRWLLVIWPKGQLEFWDVQSPIPECAQSMQTCVVPSAEEALTNVAIFNHGDSDYPSFDLTYTHMTGASAESHMVYVWQYTLCPDEQQFTSHLAYSLELTGRLYRMVIGLGDKTIASVTSRTTDNGRSSAVVHVGKSSVQPHCNVSSFSAWNGRWPLALQLLPEDRIACIYDTRIDLHRHSSDEFLEAPLMWTYEFHGSNRPVVTQPYPKPPSWRQPDSMFIHLSSSKKAYRITLPSHSSGEPSVEIVANLTEKPNRIALGFGLGMWWTDECSLFLCDLPRNGLGSIRKLAIRRPTLSTFDEQSGQICMFYEPRYLYGTERTRIELVSFCP